MSSKLSPERPHAVVRARRSIENQPYWVLEGTVNEDELLCRNGNGPGNHAVMRWLTLKLAVATPDPQHQVDAGQIEEGKLG